MNKYIKNAMLVREELGDVLPPDGPIEFDRLAYDIQQLVNCPKNISDGIPLSMSAMIAVYQMANFASQFQVKIDLDGSKVPPNVIGFVLAGSGIGKDSTVYAMEKAMNFGYAVIQSEREEAAKKRAREKAEAEDGDSDGWSRFYKPPLPLTNSISTAEGLVSRLNTFSRDGIGMPNIYVGELGSELQTNPNITDNIRLISELFDLGNKKSKAIKDHERQDQEVHGMGMCALFVGSEDNIIMDKQVAQKFRTEFITKLARRSMFVYPTKEEFDSCVVEYSSYKQMVERQEEFNFIAKEGQAYIGAKTADIATHYIRSDSRLLNISDDALAMFRAYKLFSTNMGLGMSYIYKSVQLERTHRSWKALKLAGVFAIWDMSDSIEVKHMKDAIYFVEKIGWYIKAYEEYASKEPYELLVDFFRASPETTLCLHDLKKRGFVSGSSNLSGKINELVRLADSVAGADGTIMFKGDIMSYQPFEKVGEHYASYVKVSGSKEERAVMCHSGFVNKATTFKKLGNLMIHDTAYTPFKFIDGKRSNDNIISGASWVALDVDDSDIDMYEMHDILSDYNHHIATTSDKSNPYKFRVIIEFNNIVDLPVREWKMFGKLLGEELGIKVDPVSFTKSQIMFGYSGSELLSCLDGEPFDVSNCVKAAKTKVEDNFKRAPQITRTKARSMLDNPLDTFRYAFNDNVPARSLALYRLWRHAKDLGATPDEAEKLMRDLNYEFWANPISDKRFEGYVQQMRRAYEE